MADGKIFSTLKLNFFWWKVLGLWPGESKRNYYKYYSFLYISSTVVVYNILLTWNLIYTPRTMENLIGEGIFYFNELVVMCKVATILLMRSTIVESIDLLDAGTGNVCERSSDKIAKKYTSTYLKCWKTSAFICQIGYLAQFLPPLFTRNGHGEFPFSNYYFLSEAMRHDYYYLWFVYQSVGMYGHMMYNVSIDSFISGMIFFGIWQFQLLRTRLENLKKSSGSEGIVRTDGENVTQMERLTQCLKQYDVLLRYCQNINKLFSTVMFFQFGVSSLIICVVLCAFTFLDLKTEMYIFLVLYSVEMTLEIFLPGFLGTLLTIEGQAISNAVYSSEWIDTPEPYKRSMLLLMERTKKPIILSGLKIFPLSLSTFISIMKTAYSLFTLLRSVQDP